MFFKCFKESSQFWCTGMLCSSKLALLGKKIFFYLTWNVVKNLINLVFFAGNNEKCEKLVATKVLHKTSNGVIWWLGVKWWINVESQNRIHSSFLSDPPLSTAKALNIETFLAVGLSSLTSRRCTVVLLCNIKVVHLDQQFFHF